VVTVMIVVGGYHALPESFTAIIRKANSAKELRSRTPAKLYSCKTILEWLAQDLKDMAAELGQFIQEEHAIVGQRHVTRHRHVAPADQPRIRDGVVGRATRAGRDQRRPGAGEAGDAVDTRGVEGFRQGHRRQHGREAAGQYRFARPEITIHCRHRHPLRSVDRQVPLQRSELKALGLSD
jgi:hypothetical protein